MKNMFPKLSHQHTYFICIYIHVEYSNYASFKYIFCMYEIYCCTVWKKLHYIFNSYKEQIVYILFTNIKIFWFAKFVNVNFGFVNFNKKIIRLLRASLPRPTQIYHSIDSDIGDMNTFWPRIPRYWLGQNTLRSFGRRKTCVSCPPPMRRCIPGAN